MIEGISSPARRTWSTVGGVGRSRIRTAGDDAVSTASLATLVDRGFTVIPELLTPEAAALAADCLELAAEERDIRDKPSGGTQHFANLASRVPEVARIIRRPSPVRLVDEVLSGAQPSQVDFRSPQPGHGEQKLHADDVALDQSAPWRAVVAIIALCEFSPDNGATGLVPGSHRRPDLQRLSGQLDRHPDEVVALGPAGTIFLLCGRLLHRGRQNRSTHARPAIQVVWRQGPVGRRFNPEGGELVSLPGGPQGRGGARRR